MADIFISYARPDRATIECLAIALEAQGYTVWWDRQLDGGAEFSQTIEAELDSARTVIVVWSKHSLGSHWVRDEADFARGKHKLLPVALGGVLPPLGFRQLHSVDFSNWDQTKSHPAFVDLLRSLGAAASSVSEAKPGRSPVRPGSLIAAKPCIAILPFSNMSSDEEIEFIADGLTEDVITLLSTNRHLSVPARTSVFAFKGQSVDIRGLGEKLGARYIVEGSIRKIGARARVTVQLIGAQSGEHIWAKKFDPTLEELTDSPDDIVEKIAGSLFAQLTWAEAARSEQAPPETLGAWEYCQRTAARIGHAVGTMNCIQFCLDEMHRGLAIEPDYALAHALLSWTYNAAIINGLYEDENLAAYFQGAKHHMRRARELAQDDLLTQVYIGASENFSGMQVRALQTLEQVLQRNPASAEGWYIICQVYAYLGRFDDARQAIERASALAPEGGFAPLHAWYRGIAEFMAGDYEAAAPLVRRKALEQPDYAYVNILCALCENALGDDEAARKFIIKAKTHNPQVRPEKVAGMLLTQFDVGKGQREYATLEKLWAETVIARP